MYKLIGDLSGLSFFSINETTGVVYVSQNLRLDDRTDRYTLRVQVRMTY